MKKKNGLLAKLSDAINNWFAAKEKTNKKKGSIYMCGGFEGDTFHKTLSEMIESYPNTSIEEIIDTQNYMIALFRDHPELIEDWGIDTSKYPVEIYKDLKS